ncbi:hypothetical protein T4A_13995 [Trichinella pseudospiralis]|uniref:Uncharacterized protein n=1 Tax=Trichinella pseudospiralis TaxID=6337 RepID=A0A0V1EPV0_TRIPS|nr:hypothetical protein T4A_13995 [Trichinella pseudospiralis]
MLLLRCWAHRNGTTHKKGKCREYCVVILFTLRKKMKILQQYQSKHFEQMLKAIAQLWIMLKTARKHIVAMHS